MTKQKVKYPADYDAVTEYWNKIESGEEVVSEKIRCWYKYQAARIKKPDGKYFFSNARANHIIEFAENYCRLSKGTNAGKPVRLELWEKAHLAVVFGFIEIGRAHV